jgi:hypothetical protein
MKKFFQELFSDSSSSSKNNIQRNPPPYQPPPRQPIQNYPFYSYSHPVSYSSVLSHSQAQPIYQGTPPKGSCNAGPQFCAGRQF